MAIPNNSKDIYARMREFAEFTSLSNEQLHNSLTSRIKILSAVYNDCDHIFIWRSVDKFALHVISITDGFGEDTFKVALRDLQRSEEQFDTLRGSDEKLSYQVLDQYLLPFFMETSRDHFDRITQYFLIDKLDPQVILDALDLMVKPSSLSTNKLLDVIVRRVWDQLSTSHGTHWIKKRLRRVKNIQKKLGADFEDEEKTE